MKTKLRPGRWIYDCCSIIARCDKDYPEAREHVDGGYYVILLEGNPDAAKLAVECVNKCERHGGQRPRR